MAAPVRIKEVEREIVKRAHAIESQGDDVQMVLIRMDEIIAAVRATRQKTKRRKRA